jgi:hypothetical protein
MQRAQAMQTGQSGKADASLALTLTGRAASPRRFAESLTRSQKIGRVWYLIASEDFLPHPCYASSTKAFE